VGNSVALVVVDVQLGMFESPAISPIHDGERLLKRIAGLVRDAREADVPVVFVQHDGGPGHPLERGTEGWRSHPDVAPLDGEPVVRKRTPDSFYDTTLQEELDERGVNGIVLIGLTTEYCVDTTCRRAFRLGYDVTLVKDAHGTWDTDHLPASQIVAHHNAVLGEWFASVVGAEEVRLEGMATRR